MEKNKEIISLKGPKGSMDIDANDNLTKKLAIVLQFKSLFFFVKKLNKNINAFPFEKISKSF